MGNGLYDYNNVDIDELYDYDGVYQLTDLDRGDLNANKNGLVDQTKNFAEEWALDPTGNWDEFKQDTDGDDDWDLDQDRDHTEANEIEEIDDASTHVAHDKAGNMTKTPKPSSWAAHFDLTYDAWNRLVEVEDGENTVAKYEYDGRNYRTVKKTYDAGELDETRHFYYTSDWQCIEERVGASSNADRQFVWGTRYVDDLILRDRDTSDPKNGTLNERLYSLHDPNFNLIAIAEPDGDIVERFTYNAYGKSTVLTGSFGSRSASSYDWEYRYTNRRLDPETNFMYYRNRYYHAEMGRFINRDPIGYDGNDENLYRYVRNAPLSLTDPSGEVVTLVLLWFCRCQVRYPDLPVCPTGSTDDPESRVEISERFGDFGEWLPHIRVNVKCTELSTEGEGSNVKSYTCTANVKNTQTGNVTTKKVTVTCKRCCEFMPRSWNCVMP